MLNLKTILIFFITIIPNFGCSEDPEKPLSSKAVALNALSGKWIYNDCWLDYNYPDTSSGSGEMYQNLQEEFTTANKFTFIYTLYHKSSNCSQDAVARVIQTGTFNLHDPYKASFVDSPSSTVDAWQMDITFEKEIIEGNRLFALERIDAVNRMGTYFDIVAVGKDVKYDASMVTAELNRPLELKYISNRINDFNDHIIAPPPAYDIAPMAADYIGEWDLHCLSDGATSDVVGEMYTEQYDFSILSGNIFRFKNTLWSDAGCTGTEIASITMSGLFEIVEPTLTNISNVVATTFKLNFDEDATVIIIGDPVKAKKSMDYRYRSGKTYYRFMFTDLQYTLLFYSDTLKTSIAGLPDEFERHGHRY